MSFGVYLGLEKGAEGAGGGAPSAEVEAVTRHLHAYVNLVRKRDIPDIDISTLPGYSGRAPRQLPTGSVQQILNWPEIERLAAANVDVLDAGLQEVVEPFGFLGNIEEHGDI